MTDDEPVIPPPDPVEYTDIEEKILHACFEALRKEGKVARRDGEGVIHVRIVYEGRRLRGAKLKNEPRERDVRGR